MVKRSDMHPWPPEGKASTRQVDNSDHSVVQFRQHLVPLLILTGLGAWIGWSIQHDHLFFREILGCSTIIVAVLAMGGGRGVG